MKLAGHLRKMKVELKETAQYQLPLDDMLVPLNELIGCNLNFTYTGEIHCIACGRKTSKSFQQGYCYPCFKLLAECDMCLMKPEQCHYHEGTCREPSWGEQHCFHDHYVYLANSSGIKVGITRQLPTRWLDQGAAQAIAIFRVKDRLMSGRVEVELKNYVNDKTAWQRMLKGEPEPQDLMAARDDIYKKSQTTIDKLKTEYGSDAIIELKNETVLEIKYPVITYPVKVSSLNFDKTREVSGKLQGIKGQYLILDSGVLNIRKFAGYRVELNVD